MSTGRRQNIRFSAAPAGLQRRPLKGAKKEAGFTLLEVMVSLAILGIGILTVMQLFSGSLGLAMTASEHTAIVLLAREKMAETLVDKDIHPGTTEGADEKGLIWQVEVTSVDNANTYENVNLYIMKVFVSVRKAYAAQPAYTLTSLKTIFVEE
ncbi:MAG: prepilin-type N-terminal cleavage/methylation domain-containing protein [Thermodesulfobacteriota bacterium]